LTLLICASGSDSTLTSTFYSGALIDAFNFGSLDASLYLDAGYYFSNFLLFAASPKLLI